MQTIKGRVENLKILDFDPNQNNKKLIFSLNNKTIEYDTNQQTIAAANGDEIIVAGIYDENNIFKAFSLKKIA